MQRRHFLTLCGGGLAALSLASPGQARRQLGLMSDARPVVTEHPLLHKLEWWFLMHPGMRGGTRLVDITGKYVGTATNMAAVATSTSGLSQVTTRRGGMGEWRGDGTNDHITVPHRTSLAALTVFTFVWWTRFTAVPGNTIGILEKTNAADNTDGFFLFTQTSPTASVMLTVRDGGNDSNFPSAANLSLGDSQWHQYAVRWWYAQPLASRVQFFRDGLPFTTNPDVSNFIIGPPNDGPMLLGRSNLFNSHLAGSFDHWMFFSRALANAEVRALYLDALAPRSQLLRWMTTGESTASVPPVTAPTRRRVIVY